MSKLKLIVNQLNRFIKDESSNSFFKHKFSQREKQTALEYQTYFRKQALRNYIGLDRYVVEKETIIKSTIWECQYCDLDNNGETLSCSNCGSPRKL